MFFLIKPVSKGMKGAPGEARNHVYNLLYVSNYVNILVEGTVSCYTFYEGMEAESLLMGKEMSWRTVFLLPS